SESSQILSSFFRAICRACGLSVGANGARPRSGWRSGVGKVRKKPSTGDSMTSKMIPRLAAFALAVRLMSGSANCLAATVQDPPMDYNTETRLAEEAQRKDPAWKPKYQEIALIQVMKNAKGGSVHNYCLNTNGDILACCGGKFTR